MRLARRVLLFRVKQLLLLELTEKKENFGGATSDWLDGTEWQYTLGCFLSLFRGPTALSR